MQLVEEFTLKNLSKRKKIGVILLGIFGMFLIINLGEFLGILKVGMNPQYFLAVLIAFIVTVVIHEGLHGLFFYIFSGKVKFGAKLRGGMGPAFFATSPGSLIPKRRFQLVALAPQILTICLVPTLFLIPYPSMLSNILVLTMALNFGGGCLDIYIALWSRKFPRSFLFEDIRDGLKIYEGGV